MDTTTSVTKVTKPKATKPAASAGLFGDDEEEGDLFGKPVAPKETTDMVRYLSIFQAVMSFCSVSRAELQT